MRGEIFIILAQISFALSAFFIKKLIQQLNPIFATSLISLIGTLCILPLFLYFSKEIKNLSSQMLIFAILAGIFLILFGETLYNLGLKNTSLSVASLLSLTFPFFATLLGVIFLGEKITLKFLLAAFLMIISYLLLTK